MNALRIDRRVMLVVLAIILVALGVLVAFSSGGFARDLSATMVEYAVML